MWGSIHRGGFGIGCSDGFCMQEDEGMEAVTESIHTHTEGLLEQYIFLGTKTEEKL